MAGKGKAGGGATKSTAHKVASSSSGVNHNNSIIVKNVNGSSQDRYKISNLPDKYVKAGGHQAGGCQAKGCSNPFQATAHVIKTDGRASNQWFLTRTCSKHNNTNNTDPFPLRKNAHLIPVKKVTGT